ncbi:flagellar biosynthesis protein FlhB [Niveispirillum sp. SYP-B3756]|uniref:flagellar biosynthesis protein FlhB n=1 Tax=Niveispirillum sp. SYP-B3756 TaxID=2662178 RepID=UPI001290E175|nr:flagellar biosynthesis protein FlhB [Niveispirillum sp. SYP-B3756]MQP64826.1 flagellar biosynthesis protein FlhB [Niveispirillum sp. SYP-B3756]
MAEDQDDDSKTEEPSSKRLADAREKGQVPKSQEFSHLFVLGASLGLILLILPWSFRRIDASLLPFIEQPHAIPMDGGTLELILRDLAMSVVGALAVPLLLLLVAGVLASVVQVGFLVTTEKFLKFDFSRLNPLTALGQKFSMKNLVEFLKALAKLVIVGIVVFVMLRPLWHSVDHFIAMSMIDIVRETQSLAARIIFAVLLVLLVLGGADYLYQRYTFMQQMRMTKQEVKDEFKQAEGDPLIKGKIRQLRMERARNRMMGNIPTADVVVTNPTHYAVALKYDPAAMGAPTVVAKGVDHLAMRIRELAEEHGVPLIANPALARALYATAEVNEEIPADHYKAVAQIISYVFKMKRKPLPG